jgi:L-threonylcarbamoyladenylate synthase
VLPAHAEPRGSAFLAQALEVLGRGGLLIYPTDTLYALGGHALREDVALRVRAAKARDAGKPLPLVAADPDQVRRLARLTPVAERLARFWPGPLTLVLPALAGLPRTLLASGTTLAVRVPRSALARELCADGPLISTSANRSGEAAPATCAEAVAAVGEAADLALDAGPGGGPASTIVDATGPTPVLVRAGAVPWDEVRGAWEERA